MNPEEYSQMMRLGETHWWFVGTRDILFSIIEKKLQGDRPALDVGCGAGLMMGRIGEMSRVFGIDKDPDALAHCRGIGLHRVCRGDTAALPFKSAAFPLIVAADMLEHCENDSAVLAELWRACTPGGTLLISVPAYGALWSSHDVALHHRRRYSRHELVRKTEAAGFTIERVSFFNSLLFAPIALVRLTAGKLALHRSNTRIRYHENAGPLNRIFLWIMRLERLMLRRCNMPVGVSIALLATKK